MAISFNDVDKSLDPFDPNIPFFKENTYYSNLINSRTANQFVTILQNDRIIKGLEIINAYVSNNNKTFNCELQSGTVVEDSSLFILKDNITLSIDIFKEHSILECNPSSNYFKIAGNWTKYFTVNSTFGIFNSATPSYNHIYWAISNVQYDKLSDSTIIYTAQNITVNDTTGTIIKDNFPSPVDDVNGKCIVCADYQYIETIKDNSILLGIKFKNDAPDFDWDANVSRIIFGVYDIVKDLNTYEISRFVRNDDDIVLDGVTYNMSYYADLVLDSVDGGELI